MQLEALKIFCDVVRHHSFSRGAEVNAVTQSAASQAIHQLEKRLGVSLIDRSRRPWVLTEEGRLYYERCVELVERYEQIEAEVRERNAKPTYTVRVAAIYSVGFQDMGRFVDAFRRLMPGSDVEIDYLHPDAVYERLHDDTADLGLISFPQPGREWTAIPWRREQMVVTLLANHPMASRTTVEPKELDGEDFVAFQKGLVIRREIDRYLRRHGASVNIVSELDNIETIKQAVEDGIGLSILPEPTLRKEIAAGTLAVVNLAGEEFTRPLCILHRRRRPLNPAVQQFIDVLRPQSEWNSSPGVAVGSAS